ncbi:hypothetical protein ABEB36_011726 [Hypothenemus hampei]|uniref:Enoyl reductase (ER) domain-containing protein n=1 Tax=Hypothenemus hampei TaxID=57062 RepID=A0ABD1E8T8_HYPHA
MIRTFCQRAAPLKNSRKMLAWTIHSYGDIDELQLAETRIPIIQSPDEVLVEVKAASLNPIDSFMLGGYGRKSFEILRNFEIEFPLILGRDFAGTVINKGHLVKNVNIGDEVYGFSPIHRQGTFAQTVLTSKNYILPKPHNLTYEECASTVYSSITAWSALYLCGNMFCRQNKGLRVLVLGASGGVGCAAVQLLKSEGCVVYATCSSDALDQVTSLGADVVFDRNHPEFVKNVLEEGKFHIILDAANVGMDNIPSNWQYETYITLNSPLLINNDKYGVCGGLFTSAQNLIEANIKRMGAGKTVKWGYFVPSRTGFELVHDLICQEKLKPVIQERFVFKDLPRAMEQLRKGHARGKIVVGFE